MFSVFIVDIYIKHACNYHTFIYKTRCLTHILLFLNIVFRVINWWFAVLLELFFLSSSTSVMAEFNISISNM